MAHNGDVLTLICEEGCVFTWTQPNGGMHPRLCPLHNRERRRERVRAYDRRKRERAHALIVERLGDLCVECGAKPVEYAHRDRNTKRFSLNQAWRHPLNEIEAEIAKCRVLCSRCHIAETIRNEDWRPLDLDAKAQRIYQGSKGRGRHSVLAC